MKKFTVLLAVLATLSGSAIHAQNAGGNAARGSGAHAGRNMASDTFAWGAAIGSIAVIGTVVGLAASAGSSTPATFGH